LKVNTFSKPRGNRLFKNPNKNLATNLTGIKLVGQDGPSLNRTRSDSYIFHSRRCTLYDLYLLVENFVYYEL